MGTLDSGVDDVGAATAAAAAAWDRGSGTRVPAQRRPLVAGGSRREGQELSASSPRHFNFSSRVVGSASQLGMKLD